HKEKLYWYIRRIVLDHDDAKDVTQNTFIKAWENLDNFKFQSSLYTWLYRIATNESLNHLKKKYRQANVSADEAGMYLAKLVDNSLYISGEEIYLKLERA